MQNLARIAGINIPTQKRVETWAIGHPIGYAIQKLQQSILDKTARNFIFIRYEDLCSNPDACIADIYKFFELEYYKHDFSKIDQITVEDDTVHGIYGDHTIRNTFFFSILSNLVISFVAKIESTINLSQAYFESSINNLVK